VRFCGNFGINFKSFLICINDVFYTIAKGVENQEPGNKIDIKQHKIQHKSLKQNVGSFNDILKIISKSSTDERISHSFLQPTSFHIDVIAS
jgi:hypothetical protein